MADLNGIPLVTRKDWGARPTRGTTPLPVEDADGCAVHYSAGGSPSDHRNCAATVRGIQNYHMDVQGWQDIAYSWLGCPHGYLFRGRGLGVRTAANGTNAANSRYYAYCFLGSDTARRDVTPEARKALLHLLVWLNRQIPGPMYVCPHSKFTSTGCPGDELRALLAATGWKCK
jgi:hypothetical protein